MPDDRSKAQRSETMRRVRSRGTSCELALRAELRRRSIRFRAHRNLPGRPDFTLALPPGSALRGVAVFVDGCFWHGCPDHCRRPSTHSEYWRRKIDRNMARDRAADAALRAGGWRVLRIWEHALRESPGRCGARVARCLATAARRAPAPAESHNKPRTSAQTSAKRIDPAPANR